MTPATRVRDARLDDAPAIARIHVTMWRHAYRDYLPASSLDGLSIEARERFWSHALGDSREQTPILVALRNDEIVGFCAFGPCRDAEASAGMGELYAIYVSPDRVRTGAGSALMAETLRRLRAAGFDYACLWVLTENAPARAFYERHGWSADGITRSESVQGNAVRETRYTYSLDDSGPDSSD